MSYLYVYPIRFFNLLFYPVVKGMALLVNFFFRRQKTNAWPKKELSLEEIKHFLSMETQLFKHNPETLKMLNEIIDISQKDIKAIMTPRVGIVAIKESGGMRELKKTILEKKFSKIPVYKGRLDNITGIIDSHVLLPAMLLEDFSQLELKKIAAKPIFVSEYSSLNYILNEFKKHSLNLAVVLDEYGSTIGIITLSDILRGVLGDLDIGSKNIQQIEQQCLPDQGQHAGGGDQFPAGAGSSRKKRLHDAVRPVHLRVRQDAPGKRPGQGQKPPAGGQENGQKKNRGDHPHRP